MNNPVLYNDPSGKFWQVVIGIGRFIIGKIIGEEIGKVLPPSEQEEIDNWKKEEQKKREREREGCGVTMSCEPDENEPKQCPAPGF